MAWPNSPTVYEINTYAWLHDLSRVQGHHVTLGTVGEAELERLASFGFDGVWLMGVWQRSPLGRTLARQYIESEYRRVLRDCRDDDVVGSPYAVHDYRVDSDLGGDEELDHLRQRLRKHGLRLILDFVPNHLAIDHPWVDDHPERFVQQGPTGQTDAPEHYFSAGKHLFAHGRDPNFEPWTDTVQLDYRYEETREAMTECLLAIAERCDGVRCDMAMLLLRDVFLYTWGNSAEQPEWEFWEEAIQRSKAAHPDFLMLAEVYWGLEPEVQQFGFDFAYDKGLYDVLLRDDAAAVCHRLLKSRDYQSRLMRFVENHDERRAVEAFGGPQRSRAVATLSLCLPGMRMVHEKQIEGFHLRVPVQLGRRCNEPAESGMQEFYGHLLAALREPVFHKGDWRLLAPQPVAPGDNHRSVVAYRWVLGEEGRLIAVNLSAQTALCVLPLEMPGLDGHAWRMSDVLGDGHYVCDGDKLASSGLDISLPAYGFHLFRFQRESVANDSGNSQLTAKP